MDVDIIDGDVYSGASANAKRLIEDAQKQKNEWMKFYRVQAVIIRERMSKQGIGASSMTDLKIAELAAEVEEKIAEISKNLLYDLEQLNYDTENYAELCPYTVDADMAYGERYAVILNYYAEEYEDDAARMEAFILDGYAREYLTDDYYTALYYELLRRYEDSLQAIE